jgi:hypothetical protein
MIQRANAASVRGLIRIDAPGVEKRLEDGEWNLSPEQRAQELSRAKSQREANEADRRTALKDAVWEKQQASLKARDEYTKHIFNGTFRATEAVSDPRLDAVDREHLIVFNKAWWDKKLGEEKRSNPTVVRDLMLRIYAPEGDPAKVFDSTALYEPLRKGDLNATDYDRLRRAIAEQRDPNNSTFGSLFHGAQSLLSRSLSQDPTYIGRPHIVAGATNAWAMAVREKTAQWRKENKNPAELFSPSAGKDYVLHPTFVAQFVQAAAQPGAPVVSNDADYQQLQPGTTYLAPDGTLRRKPSALEQIPMGGALPEGGGRLVGGAIR